MSMPITPGNDVTRAVDGTAESRSSTTPLLPGSFPISNESDLQAEASSEGKENNVKGSKRSFWKLGKKTEDDKVKTKGQSPSTSRPSASHVAPIAALRPSSPLRQSDGVRSSASPQRGHPYGLPTSPSQGISSSPRLHSPASSQIFERSVQEDVVPSQASPHLPSHIITENHIPPALDASSEAITNNRLDTDAVEIVTSSTHQPAAVTITGAGLDHQSMISSSHEDFAHRHRHDLDDNASNYGTLDSADVRRLSFVSFADVVHAEHADHADHSEFGGDHGSHRGSTTTSGLAGQPILGAPRSPSPMRSPVSSGGLGTSPPTSVSASFKEMSPSRGTRGPGSPLPAQSSPLGGELNVETMTQALRKTGSGDLSGFRSQPLSAVGNDDGTYTDRPFK